MSKSIMAVMLLSFTGLVAACSQQEEVVYVEPEPIVAEPTLNKY